MNGIDKNLRTFFLLIAGPMLASCGHRVYVQPGIDIQGIEAWGEDVRYVTETGAPTVTFRISEDLDCGDSAAGCCTQQLFSDKIEIRESYRKNQATIAHEFGHYLGYDHTDDPNSIMYGGGVGNRPLEFFDEFR